MTGSAPKKHTLLLNAGLLMASLLVALFLGEIATRVFMPRVMDSVIPGRIFQIDDTLGWKFKPNKQVVHHSKYFSASYSINAAGFRDRTHDVVQRGTQTILLFGDSQIFGWGVDVSDRFSALVEKGIPGLDVFNFSVPAYGVDQEILSYRRNGVTRPGDHVVVFVAPYTLRRTRLSVVASKSKPQFVETAAGELSLNPARGKIGTRIL